MIWKSVVSPRAITLASARWSTMSAFARKTAETVSDSASVVHNLVMDVRDSYRPELHYMRGPGPRWRAKHQFWLGFDSEAEGQHQLSPVRRRNAAIPTRADRRYRIMRARWATTRTTLAWKLFSATIGYIALLGLVAMLGSSAFAGVALGERKLPMKFSWVACQPNCRGWVSAVGIVTAETPRDFDDFARNHQLKGETVVLDSSGGSVNDTIALGRRFRELGMLTSVGVSVFTHSERADVSPEAYCESMCVFLLLSGKSRYVPERAHVRVHQIWMGDRADNARTANYGADDLMIVERDIGRLAKYTFDMGGTGDLLALSLNVPPWEDLYELSREELRLTNLITTDMVAQLGSPNAAVVELTPKSAHDRFATTAAAAWELR